MNNISISARRLASVITMLLFGSACLPVCLLAQNWTQLGAAIPGEAGNDRSGNAVSLSADGNRMAIGALENDDNGSNAGQVRVYHWNGSAWIQLGADLDGEAMDDQSGCQVALSADGNTLAVGGLFNDGNGTNAGHVRVYNWNGSTWAQVGADIDGEAAADRSGAALSLSADGTILAVGAFLNDNPSGVNAGQVRVYQWNGSAWMQLGLDLDGEAANDQSGFAVALSADGSRLAIGAPYNDGASLDVGHVRVYTLSAGVWIQLGLDLDGDALNDLFGWTVSLSADGNRLAIGAPDNDDNGANSGQVRVYAWSGTAWIQSGADLNGETVSDQSGIALALAGDGSRVAIGAYLYDNPLMNCGQVRVFGWDGSNWSLLGAHITGPVTGDIYGYSVALPANGSRVAVGAPGPFNSLGQVRVFQFAPGPSSISLQGNGNAIPNRALTASPANDTDFGSIAANGGSVTHTFTLANTVGGLPLGLSGLPLVTIADRDASDFTVTQQPNSPVNGGSPTTFSVQFQPSAPGLRSAIIVITHQDLPQNPFVFTVQGTGL